MDDGNHANRGYMLTLRRCHTHTQPKAANGKTGDAFNREHERQHQNNSNSNSNTNTKTKATATAKGTAKGTRTAITEQTQGVLTIPNQQMKIKGGERTELNFIKMNKPTRRLCFPLDLFSLMWMGDDARVCRRSSVASEK
jgi:hypothetical protein